MADPASITEDFTLAPLVARATLAGRPPAPPASALTAARQVAYLTVKAMS